MLQLLRTNQEFTACGCHSVLSPVQLPYLLPFKILQNMIHYTQILQDEIIHMMQSRIDNLQSNAGMSADGSEKPTFFMSPNWPSYNFPLSDPSTLTPLVK